MLCRYHLFSAAAFEKQISAALSPISTRAQTNQMTDIIIGIGCLFTLHFKLIAVRRGFLKLHISTHSGVSGGGELGGLNPPPKYFPSHKGHIFSFLGVNVYV